MIKQAYRYYRTNEINRLKELEKQGVHPDEIAKELKLTDGKSVTMMSKKLQKQEQHLDIEKSKINRDFLNSILKQSPKGNGLYIRKDFQNGYIIANRTTQSIVKVLGSAHYPAYKTLQSWIHHE